MNKISVPASIIFSTIIISLTFLVATNSLLLPDRNYATVHFEGGYKRIGVIESEEIFSKAEIKNRGEAIYSGSIEDVINWLQNSIASDQEADSITWREGINIKASVGVKWVASESNFNLTTESFQKTSTAKDLVKPKDIIAKLKAMMEKVKQERQKTATESLKFSTAPEQTFSLSKLLAILKK